MPLTPRPSARRSPGPTCDLLRPGTPEQQSGLVLHRTRHLFIRQQTAVINAIRAHIAEFGIVAPVGRNGVEELLGVVVDPSDKRLPEGARACLTALGAQLRMLKAQILEFDRMIRAWHRSSGSQPERPIVPQGRAGANGSSHRSLKGARLLFGHSRPDRGQISARFAWRVDKIFRAPAVWQHSHTDERLDFLYCLRAGKIVLIIKCARSVERSIVAELSFPFGPRHGRRHGSVRQSPPGTPRVPESWSAPHGS